jgi:hypothetical protein
MEARFWAVGHRPALSIDSTGPTRTAPGPTRPDPTTMRQAAEPQKGASPNADTEQGKSGGRWVPPTNACWRPVTSLFDPPGRLTSGRGEARQGSRNAERQAGHRERLRSVRVADFDAVLKLGRNIAGLGVAVGDLPLEDGSEVD